MCCAPVFVCTSLLINHCWLQWFEFWKLLEKPLAEFEIWSMQILPSPVKGTRSLQSRKEHHVIWLNQQKRVFSVQTTFHLIAVFAFLSDLCFPSPPPRVHISDSLRCVFVSVHLLITVSVLVQTTIQLNMSYLISLQRVRLFHRSCLEHLAYNSLLVLKGESRTVMELYHSMESKEWTGFLFEEKNTFDIIPPGWIDGWVMLKYPANTCYHHILFICLNLR